MTKGIKVINQTISTNMNHFSISGKVAIITSASGVLGGSVAKSFIREGAKVVALDLRQDSLDRG